MLMNFQKYPVVGIYIGDKPHIKDFIRINVKYNKLILIGTKELQKYEQYYDKSVFEFICIDSLYCHYRIEHFYNHYNSFGLQWDAPWDIRFAWIQLIYLKKFMEMYDHDQVIHLDCDCVLLDSVNNFKFTKDTAYHINNNYDNPCRMSSSIHSALLSMRFLNEFVQLFEDVFVNKTKQHLIQDKIDFHKKEMMTKGHSGLICEMTFAYILRNSDIQNLFEPTNDTVFNHTMFSQEGHLDKYQYEKGENTLNIYKDNNNFYIYDNIQKKYIRLNCIHFMGPSKRLLMNYEDWTKTLPHVHAM